LNIKYFNKYILETLNPVKGLGVLLLNFVLSCFFISCSQGDSTSNPDFVDNEQVVISLSNALKLRDEGNREDALEAILVIYQIAEKEKDYSKATQSAKEASFIYRSSGLYMSAISYGKKALKNSLLLKDELDVAIQYSNLAKTYFYCATSDEVKDSRTTMFMDSTQAAYDKVIKMTNLMDKNDVDVKNLRVETYTNLGGMSFELGESEKAENYIKKALGFYPEKEVSKEKSYLFNTLGNINLANNEFKQAIFNYELALANSQTTEGDNYLDVMRRGDIYINLSWAKFNLNDISSYEDLDEGFTAYMNANDKKQSANLVKLTSEFNSLETIRDAEQAKETLQKFLLLLGLLAVFIIGTLFTLFRATQLKQKNLELQIDKDQLLQQSELERMDNLSQTKVLNATIDGRESERKLIAEILHDSVSSLLSSANLHLQASRSVYDEIPMEIEKSQRIISEASDKIRNLSHELISSVLLKFGLSYSIFDLCEKYSNSQIELVSDINKIQRYDQAFEIKINNIIEELVNNILKHSKASEAIISLEQKGRNLYLEITDNGDGFKLDQAVLKDGLGLNQIKARISMMEGSINIDSEEGLGTTINIEVPIVERPIVKREVV
jgi:signal transduction histidine kinase